MRPPPFIFPTAPDRLQQTRPSCIKKVSLPSEFRQFYGKPSVLQDANEHPADGGIVDVAAAHRVFTRDL